MKGFQRLLAHLAILLTFNTAYASPTDPTDENFIAALQKSIDNQKIVGVCIKVNASGNYKYGNVGKADLMITDFGLSRYRDISQKELAMANYLVEQGLLTKVGVETFEFPSTVSDDYEEHLFNFTKKGSEFVKFKDYNAHIPVRIYTLCSGKEKITEIIQASSLKQDHYNNTFVTVFAKSEIIPSTIDDWARVFEYAPSREIKATLYLMHNGWMEASQIRR